MNGKRMFFAGALIAASSFSAVALANFDATSTKAPLISQSKATASRTVIAKNTHSTSRTMKRKRTSTEGTCGGRVRAGQRSVKQGFIC